MGGIGDEYASIDPTFLVLNNTYNIIKKYHSRIDLGIEIYNSAILQQFKPNTEKNISIPKIHLRFDVEESFSFLNDLLKQPIMPDEQPSSDEPTNTIPKLEITLLSKEEIFSINATELSNQFLKYSNELKRLETYKINFQIECDKYMLLQRISNLQLIAKNDCISLIFETKSSLNTKYLSKEIDLHKMIFEKNIIQANIVTITLESYKELVDYFENLQLEKKLNKQISTLEEISIKNQKCAMILNTKISKIDNYINFVKKGHQLLKQKISNGLNSQFQLQQQRMPVPSQNIIQSNNPALPYQNGLNPQFQLQQQDMQIPSQNIQSYNPALPYRSGLNSQPPQRMPVPSQKIQSRQSLKPPLQTGKPSQVIIVDEDSTPPTSSSTTTTTTNPNAQPKNISQVKRPRTEIQNITYQQSKKAKTHDPKLFSQPITLNTTPQLQNPPAPAAQNTNNSDANNLVSSTNNNSDFDFNFDDKGAYLDFTSGNLIPDFGF